MVTIPSCGRERFYVELKVGETTIVSWKKLLKDSLPSPQDSRDPAAGALPSTLILAPQDAKETVLASGPPPPNRFSSVIERIERLYQGSDSDQDDQPEYFDDVDKYDTRDSFIDDRELNEYFQVDQDAKLKHEGFFIHRGKLEHHEKIKPCVPIESLATRKRKSKSLDNMCSDIESSKKKTKPPKQVRLKTVARGTRNIYQLPSEDSTAEPHNRPLTLLKDESNRSSRKDEETMGRHGYASRGISGDLINGGSGIQLTSDRAIKSASVTKDELESKEIQSSAKKLYNPLAKETSMGRVKGTVLERALLELEKGVAECCPSSSSLIGVESGQGKRIRLPRDVKQKLAKVARLAAKQGKITDEFIQRLMGILGHVVRVKTLKRHLKSMIEMGVSAMQEKEGRLQGIKEEVMEMIKLSVHNNHRVVAQDVGTRDEDDDPRHVQYRWNHAMEDKICDLYDQYVEGIDEDKGPQLRKLYAELAELWPEGLMDNVGIKLAVLRAKGRKAEASNNNMELKKRRRRSLTKLKDEDLVGGLPQTTCQSNTSTGYEGQYLPLDNDNNDEQSISFHTNIEPRIQSGSLESKEAIAGSKSDH